MTDDETTRELPAGRRWDDRTVRIPGGADVLVPLDDPAAARRPPRRRRTVWRWRLAAAASALVLLAVSLGYAVQTAAGGCG